MLSLISMPTLLAHHEPPLSRLVSSAWLLDEESGTRRDYIGGSDLVDNNTCPGTRYATGTIEGNGDGTWTLTSGVFPVWVDSISILRVAATDYTVSARDSDTQITTSGTATVAAGTSYEVRYPVKPAQGGGVQFTAANTESISRDDSNADVNYYDEDFSTCLWVWFDAEPTGNVGIMGKESVNSSQAEQAFYVRATAPEVIRHEIRGASTLDIISHSHNPVPGGKWIFLAATHDAANNLHTFYSRVEDSSAIKTSTSYSEGITDKGNEDFYIGKLTTYAGIDCKVCGAAYWRGRVLTDADWDVLFNSGNGRRFPYAC